MICKACRNSSPMSWHKDGESGVSDVQNANKHIHLALGVENTTWDKLAAVRVSSVCGVGVKLFGCKDKVSAVFVYRCRFTHCDKFNL